MSIVTKRTTHNFEFADIAMSATRLANAQKAAIKLLDKNFAVKAEFLSGVYDNEVILRGIADNVSRATSYVNSI